MMALYVSWSHIKEKSSIELTHLNRLHSVSMTNILNNYQGMFKNLGERLLELEGLENSEAARTLVDAMLEDNRALAGIGLSTPEGNLVMTSSNIALSRKVNLMQMPQTAESFRQALENDHLVLGRTYFFEGLKQWVIPMRYALRNSDGSVRAVLAAGLDIGADLHAWNLDLPEGIVLHIVRDDRYMQYDSAMTSPEDYQHYEKALDKESFERISQQLKKEYGMSLDAFKQSDMTLQVCNFHNKDSYDIVSYNQSYGLYIVASKQHQLLYRAMTPYTFFIIFGTIFINLVLFFLFRYVHSVQKETRRSLSYHAHHDRLTGLPNRFHLDTNFDTWREYSNGYYSIIFVDLNNFKIINDQYGHPLGDKILMEVAKKLRDFFGNNAMIVRQGGDEFIVFMQMIDTERLTEVARQFLLFLKRPIRAEKMEFSITASIGIARAPYDGSDKDELLRKADMAMYEAKKNHSDIALFCESIQNKITRRAAIEQELQLALERREFSMVYQPQIHARNGFVAGVEALLRWNSAKLGNVPPDEFIAVAEERGHINAIGDYVIDTTFREISALLNPFQSIHISINVSIRQLLHAGFCSSLLEKCRTHSIAPSSVFLEITESLFIEDMGEVNSLLNVIREKGFNISLDDFGTGYSSLSVLSNLPIGEVKIDKSFVRDILTDTQDLALIQSIIGIGRSLEIPTLAEGVESLEQARTLKSYGCELFQGYYFSRPLDAEALKHYLAHFKPYAL